MNDMSLEELAEINNDKKPMSKLKKLLKSFKKMNKIKGNDVVRDPDHVFNSKKKGSVRKRNKMIQKALKR